MSGNYIPIIGEELDEFPVDIDFLVENANTFSEQVPHSDLDPLGDPLELPTPGEEVREADQVVLVETVAPTRPSIQPVAASHLKMSLSEFSQETEKNIHDIVHEAIWLGKDPWEYHPFYLRIYKYITIGQSFGYVSEDPVIVINIWESFFKFAEDQYKRFRDESGAQAAIEFTGEKSPYANFLLTKKVYINGKLVLEKRNQRERQKLFKRLKKTIESLKSEWKRKNSKKVGELAPQLRNDLEMRLRFFNECKLVTFPGDVLVMNNLWTKLLGDDKTTKNASNAVLSNDMPPLACGQVSTRSTRQRVAQTKVKDASRIEKEVASQNSGREALKRLIIKVIIVPPSSATDASPKSSSEPHHRLASSSSPPPSPPTCISPVCLSSDDDHDLPIIIESSVSIKPPNPPPPLTTVKAKRVVSQKEKILKRKLARKWCPNKTQSKPGASKAVCFQKKIKTMLKRKMANIPGKCGDERDALKSRQLRMEKLINMPKLTLPGPNLKKTKSDSIKQKTSTSKQVSASPKLSASSKSEDIKLKPSTLLAKRMQKQVPSKTTGKLIQQMKAKRQKAAQLQKKKTSKKTSQETQQKLEMLINRRGGKFPKKSKSKGQTKACPAQKEMPTRSPPPQPDSPVGSQSSPPPSPPNSPGPIASISPLPSPPQCENVEGVSVPDEMASSTVQKTTFPELPDTTSSIIQAEPGFDSNHPVQLLTKESCVQKYKKTELDCVICGISVNKRQLSAHVNRHSKTPAQCPKCNIQLKGRHGLWNHYFGSHLESDNPSMAYAIVPSNVWAEMYKGREKNTKKEDGYYKPRRKPPGPWNGEVDETACCDQCGKVFCSKGGLTRHLHLVHGDGKLPDNFLQCAYCPKQFKSKDSLNFHIGRVHEGTIKSKCSHCGKDLQSSGKLWKHLVDYHGVPADVAGKECDVSYHVCKWCGVPFTLGKQVNTHVKTVHPEKFEEFLALEKEERIKLYPDMAEALKRGIDVQRLRHIIRKREERRKLKETGIGPAWLKKDYTAKRKIRNRVNERDRVLVAADKGYCPDCGGKFISKGYAKHRLVVHKEVLERDEDSVCPVEGCNRRFTLSRTMRCHVGDHHTQHVDRRIIDLNIVKNFGNFHSARNPVYQCTLCGIHLFHKAEVKVHMVFMHPDLFRDLVMQPLASRGLQKQLKCPHCDLKYICKDGLRKHLELNHPEISWRCPAQGCGQILLDPDDMTNHFLVKHGENRDENDSSGEKGFFSNEDVEQTAFNWDSKLHKFGAIRLKCEICDFELSLRQYVWHLRIVHDVEEDGDNWRCTCIPERQFKTSEGWLYHLANTHREEVVMEEMLERAKKINTKVDWRTLEIKNPSYRGRSSVKLEQFPGGCNKKANEEGELSSSDDVEPEYTKCDWRNMKKLEYAMIRVRCEICRIQISLTGYGKHVKVIHCVEEDGSNLSCKCVEDQLLDKFERRDEWLYHLGTEHDKEVDMMAMLERAKKINTKVDWRTLKIKNPDGAIFGRRITNTNTYPPDVTKYDWKNMGATDYRRIPINCEICRVKLIIMTYRKHVRNSHNLLEDGDNLTCGCPMNNKFITREGWLHHMATAHCYEVNMEEMLRRAMKINTKEDWRTLKVKNPNGIRGFYAKKHRKKRERVLEEGLDPNDTNYAWSDMIKDEYYRIPVNCEICGDKLKLKSYTNHVRVTHNLEEDGDNLSCGCGLKFETHAVWLHHMGRKHADEVNMEEMLERAKKINTKVDWRTLEIKNPNGVQVGRKKSTKNASKQARNKNKRKKESSEEENETEESSSSAEEELAEEPATKSKARSSVRRSSRQPKKNVRYSEKLDDSESDQNNEEMEKRLPKKRGLPKRTRRVTKPPKPRKSNLVNTMEREKRLTIKLTRLTEAEIKKYSRTRAKIEMDEGPAETQRFDLGLEGLDVVGDANTNFWPC